MEGLKAPVGGNKKKQIVGRGYGSRRGRFSGRGMNGQNARSGGGVRVGFEGGQMPLYRRLATRGFSNDRFKVVYQAISLTDLARCFEAGSEVNDFTLREMGLLKGLNERAKILANGTIDKAIKVDSTVRTSAAARAAIEAAGGSVETPVAVEETQE